MAASAPSGASPPEAPFWLNCAVDDQCETEQCGHRAAGAEHAAGHSGGRGGIGGPRRQLPGHRREARRHR
eukprot:7676104-Pyramimonas_sp.AAC.1